MSLDDNIQIREWESLKYHDPVAVLRKIRCLEQLVSDSSLPNKAKRLRTNKLNKHREGRDAALFCLGMKVVLKTDVFFALIENQDYDFVVLRSDGYCPVQLKEVVPEDLNRDSSIENTLEKFKKYPGSGQTVAAIRVNRGLVDVNLDEIKCPNVSMNSVWLFGACSPDGQNWFIYGDMLGDAHLCKYTCPS